MHECVCGGRNVHQSLLLSLLVYPGRRAESRTLGMCHCRRSGSVCLESLQALRGSRSSKSPSVIWDLLTGVSEGTLYNYTITPPSLWPGWVPERLGPAADRPANRFYGGLSADSAFPPSPSRARGCVCESKHTENVITVSRQTQRCRCQGCRLL